MTFPTVITPSRPGVSRRDQIAAERAGERAADRAGPCLLGADARHQLGAAELTPREIGGDVGEPDDGETPEDHRQPDTREIAQRWRDQCEGERIGDAAEFQREPRAHQRRGERTQQRDRSGRAGERDGARGPEGECERRRDHANPGRDRIAAADDGEPLAGDDAADQDPDDAERPTAPDRYEQDECREDQRRKDPELQFAGPLWRRLWHRAIHATSTLRSAGRVTPPKRRSRCRYCASASSKAARSKSGHITGAKTNSA